MPSAALQPWADGFTGYVEDRGHPVRRVKMPSSGAVLVLGFGDPLRVAEPPSSASPRAHAGLVQHSFAGGLTSRAALVSHGGRQEGIQVRLSALTLHALLGTPLNEISEEPGGVVDLAHLDALRWADQLSSIQPGAAASPRWKTCSSRDLRPAPRA